ncbi:MAG: neutral/alkaline non-lysosomal ceramidase N-terminal domain-containing protein, partial [Planctomycetaceae bacterium]
MRWLALFLVCSVFLPVASALAGSSEPLSGTQTWQAGAAAVVITPPEAMWMSGYASRDRPAQGKIHDLFVKALALRDPGGRTAVLLTCDLVGIDRATSQQICRRIQERHQLSRDQMAIATSHTHSGPVVGTNLLSMYSLEPSQQQLVQQYTGLLTDWCVTAADQAVAALQPVQLQVSEGVAKFAVNRRNNREPDVPMLRTEGKLVGPVDHRVPVLAARAADGKLVAVLFGYACHATVLSGMDWCGDWPGFAQLEIEKAHPGTIALFWAGCGADQNPLPRRTVELAMEYGRQ